MAGAAQFNRIVGNFIGLDASGSHAVPNAVAGIILSNADNNQIGGLNAGEGNVISANSLDGILLVNDDALNKIQDNFIGTDSTGNTAEGNSADGIFLLANSGVSIGGSVSGSGTITGNVISGNVISGNNEDGIQIFGRGALQNTVSGNTIGLGKNGSVVFNAADGILLNDPGPGNVIGGLTATPGTGLGNVISGNRQSGIAISDISNSTANGTAIEGNLIGTNLTGTSALGNGAYGVLINGSSGNSVGGLTATPGSGLGNVISGNSLAGIQIFGPTGGSTPSGGLSADHNLVEGNLIGTDMNGSSAVANSSDGVEIYNGSDNTIGGTTPAARNIISGNAINGVFIYEFPLLTAASNEVIGNYIGMNAAGSGAIGNIGNGVEIIDGTNNSIGGIGTGTVPGTEVPASSAGAGNVISGNDQWGIEIVLSGGSVLARNSVVGNYIGTDATGMTAKPNMFGGILVNNLSVSDAIPQTIGGTTPGAGNLISGNNQTGIELLGPQIAINGTNNVVEGNLIGLNVAGALTSHSNGTVTITGNGIGILIDNSPGNSIGGTTAGAANIISGNSVAGIDVVDALSTGTQIQGNAIGTNLTRNGIAGFAIGLGEQTPPQNVGVLIEGGSGGNTVGGLVAGAGNVISGNIIGVQLSGLKEGNGQFAGGVNVVAGNLIGTDATGTQPVSNLDVGVFINNSQTNTVGPGNVISANGIAGIEILNIGSTGNLVAGNTIGLSATGQLFPARTKIADLVSSNPQSGIPVFTHAQVNGVVIIGASRNVIGLKKNLVGSQESFISGNIQVGVYISSRDFSGVSYPTPVNNAVSGNAVQKDGLYGVLLYDAPNNPVRPFTSLGRQLFKNTFGGDQTNFRDFLSGFDIHVRAPKTPPKTKATGHVHKTLAQVRNAMLAQKSPIKARPRVPALFERTLPPRHAHNNTAHHRAK